MVKRKGVTLVALATLLASIMLIRGVAVDHRFIVSSNDYHGRS
jgi:hypothetical protein